MADPMQQELRMLLAVRRARLQRAETNLLRARTAQRRAEDEVVARQAAAEEAAIENKAREAELALELFNRKTVLAHIESFRREVGLLRRATAQACEDVDVAKQNSQEAKARTREAVEDQRSAHRAVEKLEFGLQELAQEAATASADEAQT